MTLKQATAYPLRMPQDLRDAVEYRAKGKGRSLNAEIVASLEESVQTQNIKIILLPKSQRIVSGKFLHLLDIDFRKKQHDLKKDIERLLPLMSSVIPVDSDGEIEVYQGSNHLDIIIRGEGSLGWLIVSDVY